MSVSSEQAAELRALAADRPVVARQSALAPEVQQVWAAWVTPELAEAVRVTAVVASSRSSVAVWSGAAKGHWFTGKGACGGAGLNGSRGGTQRLPWRGSFCSTLNVLPGNAGGTLIGAGLSGQDIDGAKVWEATWQGGLAAAVGTPAGAAAAGKAAKIMDGMATPPSALAKSVTENVAGGVVGNVAGGLAVDSHTALTTNEDPEWGKNALINAVGGALGGGAVGGAGHYRDTIPVAEGWDASRYGSRGSNPDFAIEVPAGGVGAGLAGAGGELAAGDDQEGTAKDNGAEAPKTAFGRKQRSLEEDFG